MAACKNCLHYEVCADVMKKELFIKEKMLKIANPICKCFLDKSKIIELPCKVGDTVYEFDDIVDVDFCNECESYYAGGMGDYPCCEKTTHGFRHSKCIKIVERVADEDFILRFLKYFGKTVFLTREEAERALKEREKYG